MYKAIYTSIIALDDIRPCLDAKNILDLATVALSFVYDKYYPIIN